MLKKFIVFLISFLLTIAMFSDNSKVSKNFIYPTNSTRLSSDFGYREIFGKTNFHNGIDFPLTQNTKVICSLDGVVTFAGFTKDYGNCIIILHNNGYKTLYGHLSENYIVDIGNSVYQGMCIGYVGPKILSNGLYNGITTGSHLHFSIFNPSGVAVDPQKFIQKSK